MKALVTGAKGFIAGYLIQELVERGWEVVGLDNASKYGEPEKSYDGHPAYRYVRGDAKDAELLKDLLGDEQLRQLAIEGQDRYWRQRLDPDRAKCSKNKHKDSDYLLTGLLFAKQDGAPLVGVLCGRVGKKKRYYRHRRGSRGYIKGSVFNGMVNADVEQTVIDAVQTTLLDEKYLRGRLTTIIETESKQAATVDVEELRRQREKLKKRTELIVATLDEETLVDARSELERLKSERRRLDEQIAAASAPRPVSPADIDELLPQLLQKTKKFFQLVSSLPKHLVKEWLAQVVQRVVVDMETKALEIEVLLPPELMKAVFPGGNAMRLVSSSPSPSSYETHLPAALIAMIDCQFQKASNRICYSCHRRSAA